MSQQKTWTSLGEPEDGRKSDKIKLVKDLMGRALDEFYTRNDQWLEDMLFNNSKPNTYTFWRNQPTKPEPDDTQDVTFE